MRIGVPKGFFYYAYEPFIDAFSQLPGLEIEKSGPTNQQVLELGRRACVDEACLPAKVLCGHVQLLSRRCDFVAVPRIMNTEFGESICPKVAGAADLLHGADPKLRLAFTEPLYLNHKPGLERVLWRECKKLGVNRRSFKVAFLNAIAANQHAQKGIEETQYPYKVFLAGHCYNLYDPFVNMDVIRKLHRMGIGVITEERISRKEKDLGLAYTDLMKKPYWCFFVNNFGALHAMRKKNIDGILYLSSFSCGTDSFTIEMLKNNLEDLPLLVLKLDEQRGEAGFDTRLEAFFEVLKGRRRKCR